MKKVVCAVDGRRSARAGPDDAPLAFAPWLTPRAVSNLEVCRITPSLPHACHVHARACDSSSSAACSFGGGGSCSGQLFLVFSWNASFTVRTCAAHLRTRVPTVRTPHLVARRNSATWQVGGNRWPGVVISDSCATRRPCRKRGGTRMRECANVCVRKCVRAQMLARVSDLRRIRN